VADAFQNGEPDVSTVVYRRRPRQKGPQLPSGELPLEPPPDLPLPGHRSALQLLMIIPMLCMALAMGLMYAGQGFSGRYAIVGGLMGVGMIGMIGMSFMNTGDEKSDMLNARRDYMRYLAQSRRRVRRAAQQQRSAMRWRHPDPTTLWTHAASARLWERTPTDADFCETRLSVGNQQLAVAINTPETKPVEDLEPMSAIALRRFVKAQSTVPGIPIAIQLRTFRRVLVRGDARASRAMARAMLAQLAVFHAPDDLIIAVVADPTRRPEWDWLKWLPHSQHREQFDAAGARRLVVGSLSELEGMLSDELSGRSRGVGGKEAAVLEGRHVVVIQDGGEIDGGCQLTGQGLAATTVIELNSAAPRRMQNHQVPIGIPDRLSLARATAVARQISKFRLATKGFAGGPEPLSVSMELPDLLGIGDAGALDPRRTWKPDKRNAERLKIPLGLDPNGDRIYLDFKEAAQSGMGPHGLIIGATGSGKSELLRTIVSGLAITHSSEELNMVLVDFKGGATFATLDRLPHTSAVITNLEEELHLVDRMGDAINGEIIRRQQLLRDAGNYVSQRDYERERRAGAALAPLPSLLIICDEFSEMLAVKPDFIDLFVMIGRLGRSLGVHLLLASQRLEEGRLRGLESHLSYRVGLRTFSESESRTVLGVPDAFELPQAPGHGYLKTDQETMLRFRSAYVSGEYKMPLSEELVVASDLAGARGKGRLVPFTIAHQPLPESDEDDDDPATEDLRALQAEEELSAEDDPSKETMLSVITKRLQGFGPPAHQVWLPPLDDPASLDQLYARLDVSEERGLHAPDWPGGSLTAPIGLMDKPFEQRRDLLTVDLSGAGGNMVIVGGPRSGKSTCARTVIAGLSLSHTPDEIQIYGVDLGGGGLRSMEGLPHVGGIGSKQDSGKVRRIVAQLRSIIDDRDRMFAERGIDSMDTFRQLRAKGDIDDPLGDVFLVLDNWFAFREDFEPLEDDVSAISQRGLAYGVHVVLTCSRWMDMRPGMRDLMGTRVELKLNDPLDSEIDRKAAENVPERSPGRGVVDGGYAVLAALPRIDGSSEVGDLADGLTDFIKRSSQAWTRPPAEKVRLLPHHIEVTALPEFADNAPVPMGIEEFRLGTFGVDFNENPHLVVLGDGQCGKTNVLRTLCHQLSKSTLEKPPKMAIVDYRRGLLGEVDDELLAGFAASASQAEELISGTVEALRARLPGPDVTPEQLRARNWWTGSELFIVVDDYDIVAGQITDPLEELMELLPQARDIGMHLVLARRMGGVSRILYQSVVQTLIELQAPVLAMSGSPEEGRIIGNFQPSPQRPGRGTVVDRDGQLMVQAAWTPSKFDEE
jgi:S-DNA-T family DNA segregation ATPase FtsK/SpoIIIE